MIAIVLGHQNGEKWEETWQMLLFRQTDGNSRLIFRDRSPMTGFLWKVIHPGEFLMQYGMLNGIKSPRGKDFQTIIDLYLAMHPPLRRFNV